MEQDKRIKILYEKYLDRTCSDEELKELFDLMKEDELLYSLKDVLKREWSHDRERESYGDLDWNTFANRVGKREKSGDRRSDRGKGWIGPVSIAAGFLLVLGFAAWFWLNRTQITVYETGYGEVREIVLNDESVIKLNANSKFIWDENWKRKGVRSAKIEGEAFFDVAHNDKIPFQVVTPDLTVNVTGTTFNVTNRRNSTDVFLESGKVNLQLKPDGVNEGMSPESVPGKKSNKRTGKIEVIEMVPGDLLSYSRQNKKLVREEGRTTRETASWKNGSLIYDDTELRIVLEELHDYYGKTFEVTDPVLMDMKVDVGMPYSDWETVIGVMKLMIDAEIIETSEKVIIK